MIYHIRIFLITSLIVSCSSNAIAQTSQLHNKQYIFGPVRVSPALARLGAVGTIYGGWKLFDHADTAWLSSMRSSMKDSPAHGIMRAGIGVAKAVVLALIAERVYDYTRTVANHATWPAYAARLLQQQVNELLVITSLYNDVIVRVAALDEASLITESWKQLINKYQENCETTLQGLLEIGWCVGDEITVQLLEALRHDFDIRDTITCDRFEIMNFVRHDELLYMRVQTLYAAFDHVVHAKDALRSADVHVCHQELHQLFEMFDALYDTRSAALTDALHHCNRIATVKTTRDVIAGVSQYAQWRISNWWLAE
ncbi:MAG: hypothetical protein ACHQVS_03515 [Candidatus Babeliales bacterium]